MQENVFRPQGERDGGYDSVAHVLRSIAEYLLIITLGFFPIVFIPSVYFPLGYGKALFVIGGLALSLLVWSFSVLRRGYCTFRIPLPLLALFGIVVMHVASSFASKDLQDSLIGDGFAITSVASVALIFVVTASLLMLRDSKTRIIRLYALFVIGALLLACFHIARFVLGSDVVSLLFFTDPTSSPFGRWNDLALYFGLVVILALVAIEQLPLTAIGRLLLGAVTGGSLIVLGVVNFFAVWVVLGIVSVVMLMYGLTKHRFQGTQLTLEGMERSSLLSIVMSGAVFIVSLVFIMGGSTVGGVVASKLGISYIEVRPSLSATFEIAEQALRDHPLLGVGPNRFVDAWRLYKNPEINQTIFWATDFESGSGFVPSMVVTTGILGGVLWGVFLISFFWNGIRMFLRITHADRFWYFIGVSAFVSAGYFWIMNLIYVPTLSILILTAVTTGIFLTAYSVMMPGRSYTLSAEKGGPKGLVLIGLVIVVIVSTTGLAYLVGQHAHALYRFNEAVQTVEPGDSIEGLSQEIATIFGRSRNDAYAREIVGYQLAQIQTVLSVPEPTDVERTAFDTAVRNGVGASQIAIQYDGTDSINWRLAGQLYGTIARAGVADAYTLSKEALTTAQKFDPHNPTHALLLAQLEAQQGNQESARTFAEEALKMRPLMTEAVAFLSELDIAEGKTDEAILRVRSLVLLEPQNPARRYQLGVLYYASGDFDQAIGSFEQAVAQNQSYANARYFLALSYLEKGRTDDALSQLRTIRDLNPSNATVDTLIGAIERGEVTTTSAAGAVSEPSPTVNENGEVTTSGDTETPLVSPVNTVPEDASETPAQ